MQFAKLFEIGKKHQLLAVRDSTDEGYEIRFTTEIDGVRATISAGYNKKAECDKYFNKLDQAGAEKMFNNIKNTLS